jgi:hypothetical protein
MIARLMAAARLAKDLSSFRDKQISLSLKPDGIEIVGTYPGWRYAELIDWRLLDQANIDPLTREICRINAKLFEHWRDDGMPERKRV